MIDSVGFSRNYVLIHGLVKTRNSAGGIGVTHSAVEIKYWGTILTTVDQAEQIVSLFHCEK